MSRSSIWPIDRTLSSATTPGQSRPRGNCHKKLLHILHSSNTGGLPSDCLVSYLRYLYPSAEIQMVYSQTLANWPVGCEIPGSLVTIWILLTGFISMILIHGFRPTWPYPIADVLATREKFLEPSGYCTVMNFAFTAQQMFLIISALLWPNL